jgi:hypothetical protein
VDIEAGVDRDSSRFDAGGEAIGDHRCHAEYLQYSYSLLLSFWSV